MTAWPQLFGDQLATTSGGQQSLFPTNEHLGGEKYCVVVVTTYVCPTCPAFMEKLRTLKPEMARKGVAIVAVYMVDTERQHLQLAEEYGEVQMPIGFPTPPELLEKKRYLGELIAKSVPAYAVFDRNLEMVLGPVVSNLNPLNTWLKTLEPTESAAPPVEAVAIEGEASPLVPDPEADGETEPDEAID